MSDKLSFKTLNFPHGPKNIVDRQFFTWVSIGFIISLVVVNILGAIFGSKGSGDSKITHNNSKWSGNHVANFTKDEVEHYQNDDQCTFNSSLCDAYDENKTTKTGIVFNSIWIGMLTGFEEELVYRYLIYRIILLNVMNLQTVSNGNLLAIIISSILFGASHFSNMVNHGFTSSQAGFQATNAFFGGLLFASIYSYTGNLYIPIAIHFIWDAFIMTMTNVKDYEDNCESDKRCKN